MHTVWCLHSMESSKDVFSNVYPCNQWIQWICENCFTDEEICTCLCTIYLSYLSIVYPFIYPPIYLSTIIYLLSIIYHLSSLSTYQSIISIIYLSTYWSVNGSIISIIIYLPIYLPFIYLSIINFTYNSTSSCDCDQISDKKQLRGGGCILYQGTVSHDRVTRWWESLVFVAAGVLWGFLHLQIRKQWADRQQGLATSHKAFSHSYWSPPSKSSITPNVSLPTTGQPLFKCELVRDILNPHFILPLSYIFCS